jgi:hypothetical protein
MSQNKIMILIEFTNYARVKFDFINFQVFNLSFHVIYILTHKII